MGTCPRCRVPLVQGRAGKITAQTCPRCGGVWLATEPAERLKAALERDVNVGEDRLAESARIVAQDAARRLPFGGAAVDTRRQGIPCAECQAPMSAIRLERADIDVDTCPEHGTWFDRGELQHLIDCSRDPRVRAGEKRRFGVGLALGAAGAAVVGSGAAQAQAAQLGGSPLADSAVEVASDVGVGVAAEAGFSLIGFIFDLFD